MFGSKFVVENIFRYVFFLSKQGELLGSLPYSLHKAQVKYKFIVHFKQNNTKIRN